MKNKLFVIVFLLAATFAFGKELSAADTNLIYKVLDARLQTQKYSEPSDAISFLNSFEKEIKSSAEYNASNAEVKFIVENMLVLEKYSFMYKKDMKSPELKPFILAQNDKIEEWKKKDTNNDLSSWFYLSSGDVINSSMQFLSQATAIKQGLKEKDEYEMIAKNNPQHSFCLINKALWYYFAPAIGGGSKSVAKTDFENAMKFAACNYEKFYSRVYLSQIYYDEKKSAESEKLLKECDEILPDNIIVPFLRKLNENGYSMMYYIVNREKVDKKLGL